MTFLVVGLVATLWFPAERLVPVAVVMLLKADVAQARTRSSMSAPSTTAVASNAIDSYCLYDVSTNPWSRLVSTHVVTTVRRFRYSYCCNCSCAAVLYDTRGAILSEVEEKKKTFHKNGGWVWFHFL